MATSGTNGENRSILPGFALSLSGRKFRLAGPSLLATHIATSGATPGKVVSALSGGALDLPSWKLATGSKYLTPGASYCVAAGGKLVQGVVGQVVGTAISKTELSVNVSPVISRQYDVVSFASGAISVGPLTVGIGPPSAEEGGHGDYRLDLSSKELFGPKSDYGWGQATSLVPKPILPNDDIWSLAAAQPGAILPVNTALPCWFHGSSDNATYTTLYAWNTTSQAWVAVIAPV